MPFFWIDKEVFGIGWLTAATELPMATLSLSASEFYESAVLLFGVKNSE